MLSVLSTHALRGAISSLAESGRFESRWSGLLTCSIRYRRAMERQDLCLWHMAGRGTQAGVCTSKRIKLGCFHPSLYRPILALVECHSGSACHR